MAEFVNAAAPSRSEDAAVLALLASGGDERIALCPTTRLNRYGCAVVPQPGLAFSSCTASSPSEAGFAAARALHAELLAWRSPQDAYGRGAERLRGRLAALCGLPPTAADDIILAASGTDLHLIAVDLARGFSADPVAVVLADPNETGRGVPNALRGRAYAAYPPHGGSFAPGARLDGWPAGDLLTVPIRDGDGRAREPEAVDLDMEAACERAIAARGQALLVLLDVSKTGLAAGRRVCAAALKARHGPALTVLVDACQFRLAPDTLHADLANGFLVAVTGSKFLGGPAFSGALVVPPSQAERLRATPRAPALAGWSARADWPPGYEGRALLPEAHNLGLLLRWEAALCELEAFSTVPPRTARTLLDRVAAAVEARLADPSAFQTVAPPALDRADASSWDAGRSIFPFLIRRDGAGLSALETQRAYEQLRDDCDPVRLGQPVAVAMRETGPVAALRLAIGARQIVDASRTEAAAGLLVTQAVHALDRVAEAAARSLPGCKL